MTNVTSSPELPLFAMAFRVPQEDREPLLVSAALRLDELLRLVSRSRGIE